MQVQGEIFWRIKQQYFREQLGGLGLQVVDGMVVRLLEQSGQLRQDDIAHKIVLDKGTVARAVARLEEQGLIVRVVPDQCRREKLVSLTEAGRQAGRAIQQVMEQWNEISCRGFTQAERMQYDALLTRMTENAAQYRRGEEATNG